MTEDVVQVFARVFRELEDNGLLLVSGPEIPDVRGLVSRTPATGSWWSDPNAHTIFAVNELLDDHPDVVVTKLVANKVTFIHRRLWDQLYAVGTSRQGWQMTGLSDGALKLLQRLDKNEAAQSNELSSLAGSKPANIIRELESRLLVHARQVHTTSGKHAKALQSWKFWAKSAGFTPHAISALSATHFFEQRLLEINPRARLARMLPWITTSK